jgi:hypothetical protein
MRARTTSPAVFGAVAGGVVGLVVLLVVLRRRSSPPVAERLAVTSMWRERGRIDRGTKKG